jgi:hypothetical protein
MTIEFLRLDDAGETFAVEKACKQQHLGLKLEFSGPRTPQRNGKVEGKFQTLYGRIGAMFNNLGIDEEIRNGLWAECTSTASCYETELSTEDTKQSPLQIMFNTPFTGIQNHRTLGGM